ncbi:hypothetical protein B0T22DRAFT_441293 [Podospora appendiculata]|uniref:Uncharacterized protein n=1 Tax=Podospora appendiculata TaxID=314037 RepID=A0AAE1CDP3_9PEZI|nr:hypothetical protein B0T22DRAFT_441293 [Podospora appendiculata]
MASIERKLYKVPRDPEKWRESLILLLTSWPVSAPANEVPYTGSGLDCLIVVLRQVYQWVGPDQWDVMLQSPDAGHLLKSYSWLGYGLDDVSMLHHSKVKESLAKELGIHFTIDTHALYGSVAELPFRTLVESDHLHKFVWSHPLCSLFKPIYMKKADIWEPMSSPQLPPEALSPLTKYSGKDPRSLDDWICARFGRRRYKGVEYLLPPAVCKVVRVLYTDGATVQSRLHVPAFNVYWLDADNVELAQPAGTTVSFRAATLPSLPFNKVAVVRLRKTPKDRDRVLVHQADCVDVAPGCGLEDHGLEYVLGRLEPG